MLYLFLNFFFQFSLLINFFNVMSTTKKKKCLNCLLPNPSHIYKDCPYPCRFCNSMDHKTRSCHGSRSKNKRRTTKKSLNPNDSLTSNESLTSSTSTSNTKISSAETNDILTQFPTNLAFSLTDKEQFTSSKPSTDASIQSTSSLNITSAITNDISTQSSSNSALSLNDGEQLISSTSKPSTDTKDISTQSTSSLNTTSTIANDISTQSSSHSAFSLTGNEQSVSSTSLNENDISTVLSENGVFTIAIMTSAATFPSFFKSMMISKDQIKFCTNNGIEGNINLHTYEEDIRDVRESFRHINISYVNRQFRNFDNNNNMNNIEYTMTINQKNQKQSVIKQIQLDKIRRIGEYLRQAKYYIDVLPDKIPLRKTDISPADWRIEKYVYWERKKRGSNFGVNNNFEINSKEEHIYKSLEDQGQFNSNISGSIYDDPPDVNEVVDSWKRNKNEKKYYTNPPILPQESQNHDFLTFLSDYIEYLSEGLKFVQYNYEVNRRSELRYCSYLDKAVEIYKEKSRASLNPKRTTVYKTFISDDQDNNKDRAYLCKKKMVGRRLNKIMDQCQLNWSIIDCVEEITANFLTNVVQEETFINLVQEINKNYTPKLKKRDLDLCKSISIHALFSHDII